MRLCAENKKEIRELKIKAKRILGFQDLYPEMSRERRFKLTISLNEIMERVKYLKINRLNSKSKEYDYKIVYKKNRVKNRTL